MFRVIFSQKSLPKQGLNFNFHKYFKGVGGWYSGLDAAQHVDEVNYVSDWLMVDYGFRNINLYVQGHA